ncbi:MAG TPA: pilus assembly protein TadG-related protein, partial [Hyphomicrobiaceae bacterium]|nr:pilus assembly protein TadG-related protein [Hyphomicrobiaceae bacterium]
RSVGPCAPAGLWQRGTEFRDDCHGSMAIIAAIVMTVLVVLAGGAIDYGRWHAAYNRIQGSIDSAVLASGRAVQLGLSNSEVIAVAERFYSRNRPVGLTRDGATFEIRNSSQIVGIVDAAVGTTFLNLIGIGELPINIAARADLASGGSSGTNVELALMLDVTGSMCDDGVGPCSSGTKLNALRAAATDLVNIVVWSDQSRYTSRVALVPFSTRVRMAPNGDGDTLMRNLTNMEATWSGWYTFCTEGSGSGGSETNGTWACTRTETNNYSGWRIMPCVTDRTGPEEFTDAAPGPFTWLNAHDGSRRPVSHDSGNDVPTSGLGGSSSDPGSHWNYNQDGSCSDIPNVDVVVPLTSDKAHLIDRISRLEAYGSTGGALGTAMSWYTLSPRWSGIWSSDSRPGAYSDVTTIQPSGNPLLRKVAVLMSDGEYNTFRNWKDQDQVMVSDRAKQICANMRAAGIEIFTVGFALDQLPTAKRAIAEDTLRSCGGEISHFYSTFNAEQLQMAFRDIALQVAKLRLTQ